MSFSNISRMKHAVWLHTGHNFKAQQIDALATKCTSIEPLSDTSLLSPTNWLTSTSLTLSNPWQATSFPARLITSLLKPTPEADRLALGLTIVMPSASWSGNSSKSCISACTHLHQVQSQQQYLQQLALLLLLHTPWLLQPRSNFLATVHCGFFYLV